MPAVERKATYAAPALEKAFSIIELLAERPEGMLASEIAVALGRTLGEMFRIIVVMESAGYLQKSPINDRYAVTYKFLDIAYRATPARRLLATALPEMQALASSIGQSCHLVVVRDGDGLVIAREESPGVRGFALREGASIDLLHSCSGFVLLAFASQSAAKRIIGRAEAARGAHPDPAQLDIELRRVTTQGYALRESPVTRGVTDVSYPIFGFSGDIMAALTIPFLEFIDGSQVVELEQARVMLASTTARISAMLGDDADRQAGWSGDSADRSDPKPID